MAIVTRLADGTGPELISVPDAARRLGMSIRWTWDAVHSGRLPHCRLGRRVLIRQRDLDDFVQSHMAR